MTTPTLEQLRAQARLATLFPPTTLAGAVHRLGFVQADPIRAPARAQDLILRHRVSGYRAGALERSFVRLQLEEDFLYAYGFMPAATQTLLHPRFDPDGPAGVHAPAGLAAEVLEFVRARGPTHPRDLDARFGRDRAVNGWGGFSKATTRALESLRHYGLLRVARRRDGIRVYEAARSVRPDPAEVAERARRLVLLVASVLAPVSAVSLRGALALLAQRNPGLGPFAPVIAAAVDRGELERAIVEGETYLSPAGPARRDGPVPRDVRLLAPFDPLVWDRRRFQHLWGWEYRFEAYVPPPQRRLGYYALPLLWGDAVIGWANVSMTGGRIDAKLGFAGRPPRSQAFRRALDAELARMERFLQRRTAAPSPAEPPSEPATEREQRP